MRTKKVESIIESKRYLDCDVEKSEEDGTTDATINLTPSELLQYTSLENRDDLEKPVMFNSFHEFLNAESATAHPDASNFPVAALGVNLLFSIVLLFSPKVVRSCAVLGAWVRIIRMSSFLWHSFVQGLAHLSHTAPDDRSIFEAGKGSMRAENYEV